MSAATWRERVRRLRRRWRALGRDARGVTAIEFGILAVPFFVIIGAILETALVFFAAQVLDTAVQDSSRLLRTGQAQQAGFGLDQYRQQVCSGLYGLFDCDDLRLNVRVLGSGTGFGAFSRSLPVNPATGAWDFTQGYSGGGGDDVIMIEAYYKWRTLLDFGGFNLASLPDGTRLLGSVRVFRNEPF